MKFDGQEFETVVQLVDHVWLRCFVRELTFASTYHRACDFLATEIDQWPEEQQDRARRIALNRLLVLFKAGGVVKLSEESFKRMAS